MNTVDRNESFLEPRKINNDLSRLKSKLKNTKQP